MTRMEEIIYPEFVKDEIDKILFRLFLTIGEKPKEYTLTQVKNHVFVVLVSQVSKGLTLQQKLDEWIKEGRIEGRAKDIEVKLFSGKQK